MDRSIASIDFIDSIDAANQMIVEMRKHAIQPKRMRTCSQTRAGRPEGGQESSDSGPKHDSSPRKSKSLTLKKGGKCWGSVSRFRSNQFGQSSQSVHFPAYKKSSSYRKEMRESFSTHPKSSSASHFGTAVLSSRPVILLTPRRSEPTVAIA